MRIWMIAGGLGMMLMGTWAGSWGAAATRPAGTMGVNTRAAATRGAEWEVSVEVVKKVNGDGVKVVKEEGTMVVEVTQVGGIGQATVTLTKGEWPGRVVVRFKGFGNLEMVSASGEGYKTQGDLKAGGMTEASEKVEGQWKEVKIEGALKGTIGEKMEGIEVEVPGRVMEGTGVVRIGWIDAYR